MAVQKKTRWVLVLFCLTAFFFTSCLVQDAKAPKNEYVTVYTESYPASDSLIYQKFEREEHIRVRVRLIRNDSILQQLRGEKYNSEADLILLNDYESLSKATGTKLFRPVQSEVLDRNIDASYHSKGNYWFALSKSPLVVIYNKKYLAKDTLKNYYELISEKWKGKVAFQQRQDHTIKSFRNAIHIIMNEKADTFLFRLSAQSLLAPEGNDETQIRRIQNGQALLAVIKLSALARYHSEFGDGNTKKYQASSLLVQPIFPNQRKKGCYYTVSGAGVYRYARNTSNAVKLLEFLSSHRAQYYYASGRYDYPVLKEVGMHYTLQEYDKFRGRFYRKWKNKKK